jgi:hypothetical protein
MEQQRYQVRFDWGVAGAHAIGADADVLVWVDAIEEPRSPNTNADALIAAVPNSRVLLTTGLPTAAAVAQWIVEYQVRRGERISIAIVAAGSEREGSPRFAVEDLLSAGAVIDALSGLGLDATSPEAAAAEAAFRGLARATSHVLTASTTAATTVPAPASLRINPSLTSTDVRVLRDA